MWNPFKRLTESRSKAYTLDELTSLLGRGTSSGIQINSDNAQSVTSVFAAMSFISKQVAGYPIRSESQEINQLFAISPDRKITPYQWSIATVLNLLADGNAYSHITWKANGQPSKVEFLASNRVHPLIDNHKLLGYHVDGKPVLTRNILHFRINSMDGITGRSPITVCRESVGVAYKQQEQLGQQLKNDMKPSGIIKLLAPFKDENAVQRFKEGLRAKDKGEILILDNGAEWQQVAISNADAEFLEQRKFSVDEVARMFNLDKIWLQNSGTGAKYDEVNASQKALLSNTIMPYLIAMEQELRLKLHDETTNFNLAEIQRLDVKTRYDIYKQCVDMGLLTVNDIKRKEKLDA